MKQYYLGIFCALSTFIYAQDWQQKADYRIEVELDTENHRFTGHQQLFYFNQSPDTLRRVFFHLYFNAFQPGSMMDVRSRSLPDPDPRVMDRISRLNADEIGFLAIDEMSQDGHRLEFEIQGDILEVSLYRPIPPHSVVTFTMDFQGQVPLQIRRSGRDNKEGIDYSMTQWYPKICEYDSDGWHPDPYVAREFYGVWSDFDVKITLPNQYVVAGTGVLQNSDEVGYGYSGKKVKHKGNAPLTWHFRAEWVHDFAWAADPDYLHTTITAESGVDLHFFYQPNQKTKKNWGDLPVIMKEAFRLIVEDHGPYPYPSYSFIQGGDGGMEYPMACLITGERSLGSLVGVCIHEIMHSWYQGLLGSNELLYPWMDEGFTEWAEVDVKNELRRLGLLSGSHQEKPYTVLYDNYRNVVKMGIEEPMSTHADHYRTNTAYGMAAYNKGAVFLKQLEYIVGREAFERSMSRYYLEWRFRHPRDRDLIRIFERESQMVLDWYQEYFINTDKIIEYKIDEIKEVQGETRINLSREGEMPMPIDLEVSYKDGTMSYHTVPLTMMRNAKRKENGIAYIVEKDWPWTHTSYEMVIERSKDEIKSIHIDPTLRLADFELNNNRLDIP